MLEHWVFDGILLALVVALLVIARILFRFVVRPSTGTAEHLHREVTHASASLQARVAAYQQLTDPESRRLFILMDGLQHAIHEVKGAPNIKVFLPGLPQQGDPLSKFLGSSTRNGMVLGELLKEPEIQELLANAAKALGAARQPQPASREAVSSPKAPPSPESVKAPKPAIASASLMETSGRRQHAGALVH